MSIVDRIIEKIDKIKRAYGLDPSENIRLALGRNEMAELKVIPYRQSKILRDEIRISSFAGLEIIEMNSDNYLELFRKL